MALVAVAEGLQGHFLTTIIAPELDKFRQRLSAEPTDPDELSQAHLEMLQRIAACCMLGTRASGIHRTIVSVLGLYAEYETFCRHYDEDSFAALSEAVAALQARHAKEDRADVESGMDDEQLFVRRKARDVEKRRLVDTFMIRALTKLREDFDLGLGRTVQALETLEAYSSRYQLEGLIFALRGALANTEEAQDM